jgi:dTDP-4-amino-4,6-dideoxygalactose transaminase
MEYRWPHLPPRYQGHEQANLTEALQSNVLWYLRKGGWASQLAAKAQQMLGARHVATTSSGSAAIHTALAAAGVGPGDEVITSPVTDMGSVLGILWQNAVPVFADLDEQTYNMTAATIEAAITPRTRAVEIVHLAGGPCDLDPILDLCQRRGIVVIEDCAQAWGCRYRDRHVGTFGALGCFSFNDSKHLSCGDGGLVLTNDEALYRRAHNLADKFYDRLGTGDRLHALGINYRMSELQAAVGHAQLDQLDAIARARHELGDYLTQGLLPIKGIHPHHVLPQGYCSYWFYMLRVDEAALGLSRDEVVKRLQSAGVPAGTGYLPRPLYAEPLFQTKRFFPGNVWPAELVHGQRYDYTQVRCPGAERILRTAIRLPIYQGLDRSHMDEVLHVLRGLRR